MLKSPTFMMTFIVILMSYSVHAETLDATAIITKSYETPRVDDQICTLTFTFSAPDKKEQKVIYTMVWKNMKGDGGYDNKAMFFTESPPEKRGITYLGWLAAANSSKDDDEWIYLPELRLVRRIAYRDHDHAHDDDEFGNSLITREHLDPRPPQADDHTLIGAEMLDGKIHHLIASTPKPHHNHGDDHMSHETAAKTIRWIDQDSHRINRMQFFDAKDKETLDIQIAWTQVNDYWLWKTITATDPRNQARTVMEIGKIRINSGLDDKIFSKRTLNNWPNSLH